MPTAARFENIPHLARVGQRNKIVEWFCDVAHTLDLPMLWLNCGRTIVSDQV